jgi:hypothetical protein
MAERQDAAGGEAEEEAKEEEEEEAEAGEAAWRSSLAPRARAFFRSTNSIMLLLSIADFCLSSVCKRTHSSKSI